jgi:hypothetical protein
MKKNNNIRKQGHLFNGFEPKPERKKGSLTLKDILKTFKGSRVVSERQAHVEFILIATEKARPYVLEFDESQQNKRGVFEWSLKESGGYKWRRLGSLEEGEIEKEGEHE